MINARRYLTDPAYKKFRDTHGPLNAEEQAAVDAAKAPSLIRKAGTFIKAVAQHAVAGAPTCSDKEFDRRMSICKACPEFNGVDKCKVCGCGLKMKARWSEQKCPLGKWTLPTPPFLPGVDDPLPEPEDVPVPEPWPFTAETKARHIAGWQAMCAREFAPPTRSGQGIVTCGGGKYWPMIVVAAKMLRDVSDLPMQVWYRGEAEPVREEDVAGLNVDLVDATKIPCRILRGWEGKTHAIINSGFERVMFLDADAYVVSDPQWMLDLLEHERFVFWTDLPNCVRNVHWEWYGMPPSQVPPVQGGQLAIHVPRFWRELVLSHWLNQHSDYFYKHQFGDQDSWRVALAATGGSYFNVDVARWRRPAFICSQPMVVHRCQGKLWGPGAGRAPHLPSEDRVHGYLNGR